MTKPQLVVFCEGQTEQAFCKKVLNPHFFPNSDRAIQTLAVGQTRNDRHIYGLGSDSYKRLRTFITNSFKQRSGSQYVFTSFIDLYALPEGFPGLEAARKDVANPRPYVEALEAAFAKDLDYWRFVPHIQLYEFETLLFADPDAFAVRFKSDAPDSQTFKESIQTLKEGIQTLKDIVSSFRSVEHINDSKTTAPSKRILSAFPRYRKTTDGPEIAVHIGLPALREACPHFDGWIRKLEERLW